MTPSLGLFNVLKWLPKLKHLLDYQFIIKRYNSRIARWKRCICVGKEFRVSMLFA